MIKSMSIFQLVLQDSTLKVVMDHLIKGIQRCQTWARPDILKALAAVVYENCDKIQQVCIFGRFTFERIHNTKEQIYFYERRENYKAKERLFELFK